MSSSGGSSGGGGGGSHFVTYLLELGNWSPIAINAGGQYEQPAGGVPPAQVTDAVVAPLAYRPAGQVVSPAVFLNNFVAASDGTDISVQLTVFDPQGTNEIVVSGGAFIPDTTTGEYIYDWTADASVSSTTGSDLTWDSVAQAVVSAAGGTYEATLTVTMNAD